MNSKIIIAADIVFLFLIVHIFIYCSLTAKKVPSSKNSFTIDYPIVPIGDENPRAIFVDSSMLIRPKDPDILGAVGGFELNLPTEIYPLSYETMYWRELKSPKILVFNKLSLYSYGSISRHKFNGQVAFLQSSFKLGKVNGIDIPSFHFESDYFIQSTLFEHNTYETGLHFSICTFEEPLFFRSGNHFPRKKDIIFSSCNFMRGIELSALFTPSLFPTEVDSLSELQFDFGIINHKLSATKMDLKSFQTINFYRMQIDTIDISDSKFTNALTLRQYNVLNKVVEKNWMKNKFFKFLLSPYFDSTTTNKTALNIAGVNPNKLDIDYKFFSLYFNPDADENTKSATFQGLLEKYKANGESANYRAVDIDYRNMQGGFFNFLSRYWWNYGYDKARIVLWSLGFMFLFSLINYFKLKYVILAYKIESIEKWVTDRYQGRPFRGFYAGLASLLYTGALFFGIKLNFEKFDFKKTGYSLIILFQFLLGLVCTGFIINLILS